MDATLEGLFAGSPLLVALGIAALLGLRHASDPDHLVAVTSLVASGKGGSRAAARIGAWWGVGHAATLILVGLPLILFKSELPTWLETGAEKGIGILILILAARVLVKWTRGDYRVTRHEHPGAAEPRHRHLHRDRGGHGHADVRTAREALAIGLLHGLAGTGAVVVLLIAALPSALEAAAALAVFAPMSAVSMATFTSAFAWLLTRRPIEPVYRTVLIPLLGMLGLSFGLWYAGIG